MCVGCIHVCMRVYIDTCLYTRWILTWLIAPGLSAVTCTSVHETSPKPPIRHRKSHADVCPVNHKLVPNQPVHLALSHHVAIAIAISDPQRPHAISTCSFPHANSNKSLPAQLPPPFRPRPATTPIPCQPNTQVASLPRPTPAPLDPSTRVNHHRHSHHSHHSHHSYPISAHPHQSHPLSQAGSRPNEWVLKKRLFCLSTAYNQKKPACLSGRACH